MRSPSTLARAVLFTVAALCLPLSPAAHAQTCPTHYAHVTATGIGARTPLQAGVLIVTATDSSQNAINYSVPGFGIELTIPKYIPISNGALTQLLCLPRSDQTSTHVGYHFQARDSSPSGGNRIVLDAPNVGIASDTWSLDSYDFSSSPNPYTLTLTAQVPVDGSPGATGPTGPPTTFRGNYASGTTYALGEAAYYTDGSSYVSLQNGNVGKTPGVDIAWWGLLAHAGATGATGGALLPFAGATLPSNRNAFTTRGTVSGVLAPDGTVASTGGYQTSGFLFVGDFSQIVATFQMLAFGNGGALSFYDVSGTFLSNAHALGTITPGTAVSLPTGTAYVRFSELAGTADSAYGLFGGTTLPAYTPSFGFVDRTTVGRDIAAAVAPVTAAVATVPSAASVSAIVSANIPSFREIYDYTRDVIGAITNNGSVDSSFTGYGVSGWMYVGDASYVICNANIFNNGLGGGVSFYDLNHTFISGLGSTALIAGGTPIALPAGTSYLRFGYGGAPIDMRWYTGSVLPATPSPFLAWPNISGAIAAAVAPALPYAATKWITFGDSITSPGAWQAAAAPILGAPITNPVGGYNSSPTQRGAYSSGATYAAGDLVYTGGATGTYWLSLAGSNIGHAPASSPAFWTDYALSAGTVYGYPGHPMSDAYLAFATNLAANSSGPTIVTQLASALADKSIMFLGFGTNDGGTPIGALGDAPSAPGANGSLYGSVEYAVQTANAAIALTGRNIRLVLWTPYHQSRVTASTSTTITQVVKAIKDVGQEWGVPVIDTYAGLQINSANWSVTLSDTVHPTTLGYNMLGSFIARQALALATQ